MLHEQVDHVGVEKDASQDAFKWEAETIGAVFLLAAVEHPLSTDRIPVLQPHLCLHKAVRRSELDKEEPAAF